MAKKTREVRVPALRRADDVRLSGLAPTGAGTVEIEGLEVVVPGALPGDRAAFDWRPPMPGGRRGLAEGEVRILEKSPLRGASPLERCAKAGRCGGCPMACLRYDAEIELKWRQLLKDELAAAGFDADALCTEPLQQPEATRTGFRNKAVLYPCRESAPNGRGRFGFFRAGTHEVVPAEDCPLAPAWMHEAARIGASLMDTPAAGEEDLFAPYDESSGTGSVRALLMREGAPAAGATRGERLVTLVLRERPSEAAVARIRSAFAALPLEHLSFNVHPNPGNAVLGFEEGATHVIEGREAIETTLEGLSFEVRPETFLQVNTPQTPRLYERALSLLELSPEDGFLDLYSGIGTITLLGAKRARRALGIEIVAPSVACAEVNARRNGIQNARFLCGPVESVLASDAFRAEAAASRFTKAIVDPAYKGLASGVAQALAAIGLERIVYVACGPKNFVRDAKCFAALGYRLVRVEAVDLFPGALHIEAVGLFVKEAGESDT